MNAEGMDFSALLADWEAKRAALDAAIASLRAAIAAGALTATVTGETSAFQATGVVRQGTNAEIPNGAFHGKTVTAAIKAYLSAVRVKQSTRDIVEALKRGGTESTSDHFDNIVYNNLKRMHTVTGEIAKHGKLWGLSEWLSPSMRPAPIQSQTKQRTGKRKRARTQARVVQRRKGHANAEAPTLPSRMEEFLGAKPNETFTPSQIASALGVNPTDINVRLKKMVDRGRIVKVGPGKYRAGKATVVKMAPTAA
jgi:hypothetical protein